MRADHLKMDQDLVKRFQRYEVNPARKIEKENMDKDGRKGLNSTCNVLYLRLCRFMGVH